MQITTQTNPDPVTELPMVNAYMSWALIAAEEMLGKQIFENLLAENGLERFIGHYPPEKLELSSDITVGDYTQLCVALVEFFGLEQKSEIVRHGRISTKPALEQQGKLFNVAAKTAIRFLPLSSQIKTVLDTMQTDLEKIYKTGGHEVGLSLEDRGDRWAYIDESCAQCAGREVDTPICWSWVGTLEESLSWLTGKEFEVVQVECRAMGAQACVWEISKVAKKK